MIVLGGGMERGARIVRLSLTEMERACHVVMCYYLPDPVSEQSNALSPRNSAGKAALCTRVAMCRYNKQEGREGIERPRENLWSTCMP